MKIKRKLLSLILAIILLCSLTPSISYAANNNKAITKQIKTYFKYVKKYDHNQINNMMYKKGTVPYVKNAYFQKNLAYIQNKSLKYRIDNISVSGKKAKVKVSVLYYSAYGSMAYTIKTTVWDAAKKKKKINSDAFINTLATNVKSDFKYEYKRHKKIWKRYAKNPEKLEAEGGYADMYSDDYTVYTDLYTYSSFTIPMVKVGGTWKIQKMTKNMRDAYDCDVYYTLMDFSKHPGKYLF